MGNWPSLGGRVSHREGRVNDYIIYIYFLAVLIKKINRPENYFITF